MLPDSDVCPLWFSPSSPTTKIQLLEDRDAKSLGQGIEASQGCVLSPSLFAFATHLRIGDGSHKQQWDRLQEASHMALWCSNNKFLGTHATEGLSGSIHPPIFYSCFFHTWVVGVCWSLPSCQGTRGGEHLDRLPACCRTGSYSYSHWW